MSRDLTLYLDDITTSIEKIQRYTMEMSKAAFISDDRTLDAVAYNLQVIGEAVKHLPDGIRNAYPQAEWRKIAGLRDILAHAYFAVDDEILWDIIQNKLTPLGKVIRQIRIDLEQ